LQVSVIPVRENHIDYAKNIFEKLKENKNYNFRVELSDEKNGLGKNVRNAKNNKNPY
jgi:threonyl-tRNA synthetase